MMGALIIHEKAKEDILAISCGDQASMSYLLALFQQLKADPKKFALLKVDGYGDIKTDAFNVRKWASAQNTGRDLWRLKHLGIERDGKYYRAPYCMSLDGKTVHILAVVRVYHADAEFDYDDVENPIVRRIFDAYDAVRPRVQ